MIQSRREIVSTKVVSNAGDRTPVVCLVAGALDY